MTYDFRIFILFYMMLFNFLNFFLMFLDKQKAKKRKYRVPEKTFFTLGIMGGSLGGIIGMYTFRHKTKHTIFILGMPCLFIFNLISFYLLYKILF